MQTSMNDETEAEKRGAAYKYGLVTPFLRKFPFEDMEHLPNSAYYSSDEEEKNKHPNAHEVVKRFLKQVRESNGYDVDCVPPPRFGSPFQPKNPVKSSKLFINDMMKATLFAIGKINAETGKSYELVQVDKALHTNCSLMLLTFTVKDADDGSSKTIRAMVDVPYCNRNYTLEEWMFHPLPPVAESREEDLERKKAKYGEVPNYLERLSTADESIIAHIFSMLDEKSAIKLSVSCKSCCAVWASLKMPPSV